MYDQTIRPSRRWYWVAGGLLAGALACLALAIIGFLSLGHQIDTFQRVKVPGQGEVTFTSPGDYLLYFEGPGMTTARRSGTVFQVLLRSAADGTSVPITKLHSVSEKYTLGGHTGEAVAFFTITRPGRYLLSNGGATSPAPDDIAVGRGIGTSLARPVVLILAAVLILLPGGTLTGIITAVRRRRSRRRMQTGMAQPFAPYPAPRFGQPPPPGGQMPPAGGPSMPTY
jgi:hypothetical protein